MYETIIPAVCLQYSSICKEAEISVESDPARTIAVDDAIGSKLAVNIIGQDVSSTFDPESKGLAPSFYTLLDPAVTIIRPLTAICFERNIGVGGDQSLHGETFSGSDLSETLSSPDHPLRLQHSLDGGVHACCHRSIAVCVLSLARACRRSCGARDRQFGLPARGCVAQSQERRHRSCCEPEKVQIPRSGGHRSR